MHICARLCALLLDRIVLDLIKNMPLQENSNVVNISWRTVVN